MNNNKAQALFFFIIFISVISLGLAGFYFISYKYENKTRKETEEQLDILKKEKDALQKQLEDVNREKIILEDKVNENDKIVAELKERLDMETQAKEVLMGEEDSLQNELFRIQQETKDVKETLLAKNEELARLQKRLNAVILERNELRKRISESSSSDNGAEDLDKIVVSPESSVRENKQKKPPFSTEVLLVNEEYGFLVLNAGLPNNVERGDIFEIFHKGVSLGRVSVEKINDTICAADFLKGFKKDQVGEGDIAKRIN
ncbi:MAG: hypothetical protein PHS93_06380 [Candidatus Omnitrophica bacterium]|nr:hypothetical protein [Candidatus Omnitrophota bacterium]MDD5352775.1 hypothetical protein [Candidatus Omnitrophota bacterium]MDD5550374.1 hypothetical protein [Candidatus Omnitrophota bacterium]